MDRHRLAVVVENDDLKEPASPVGTDVEVTVASAHYADGIADCVLDVLVGNTMLAGVVRDLNLRKLPCLAAVPQVTLRTQRTWLETAPTAGCSRPSTPAMEPGSARGCR